MVFNEIADAFRELADTVKTPGVPVKKFSEACGRFFPVFTVFEDSFRFAKTDFVNKVNDLAKASRSTSTLEAMVERDIKANRVRTAGSCTRNLLRIKRGLEMIRAVCKELLATESNSSIKDAVLKAYNEVFAQHHTHAIQEAAATGFGSLLTKDQLFSLCNETEATAKIHIKSYIAASTSVIKYLDNLFITNHLGIDW